MNEPGYYIAPDNLLLILAITGAMAVLTMAEAIALWRISQLPAKWTDADGSRSSPSSLG